MEVSDKLSETGASQSVIYLLTAPELAADIRETVVEQVATGEVSPKVKDVEAAIKAAKADAEAAKKKADGLQKQLDMLIDAQQEATDEHDQELQSAQEREKALRKTIDVILCLCILCNSPSPAQPGR